MSETALHVERVSLDPETQQLIKTLVADQVALIAAKRGFKEREASSYTGVSTSYLQQGRYGTLADDAPPPPPHIRIGRAVRYLKEDLDDWLNRFERHQVTRGYGRDRLNDLASHAKEGAT